MVRFLAALWLAVLVIAAPAAAQTFPKLSGRVVDQADLLQPAEEAELTAKLEGLEQRSGRQLVVATVASLEGRTIEDYGYRLGREWKIGQTQEDDGVVLLVAPNERKVRIETGYGARVFLTDAVSSVIIRNSILPRFKEGDFAGGIGSGVDQIIGWMELPAAEAAKRAQEVGAAQARQSERGINPFPVIVIVFVFFMILSSIARRVGGRRYRGKGGRRGGFDSGDMAVVLWGLDALTRSSGRGGGFGGFGGGGGGGFGGFSGGGGSFGGGGASGGW